MKVEVKLQVSKEAYELGKGLKDLVLNVKKALSDGWQPGQDLPVVIQAVVMDLVPAVQGIEKLDSESKEDLEAFVMAFLVPAKELAFNLLKKDEVVPV